MPMAYPENEDAEQQIDSSLIKLAEQYASCDRRSADINEERSTIRDNVSKLGIDPLAWQHAVGMVKKMSEGERRDYQISVNRVLKAIGDRQNELFPIETEKIRKRQEKNAKPVEADPVDADTNPRSDPNAGGAKPMTGDPEKPWPDDVATGTVQNPPGEAEAGDAALNAALPETKGKKKSQSQIAAEKAAAAGTDKPLTVN